MFPIILNDGINPFPDDDIYYIVCKEGVYLKKKLGVMESIAPVKTISILKSIQTMAKMHIKKIPAIKAQQIINFFKAVYEEHHAEAIVLLFYNQDKKQYKIICPHQEVSGGGADYTKGIVIENYDMIGTIHSHASMSAFHSGIDDADEKNFDGLHITFGDMRDDDISVSASIVANGLRVIVDPRSYINQIEMTVDVNEEEKVPYSRSWKWDVNLKKMVQIKTGGRFYTRTKFDQRFKIKLSKDPKFDSNWMDLVEKKTYTYKAPTAGSNWWDGWYGHNSGYGEPSYWKNWRGHQNTRGNKPIQSNLPTVVKPKDNLTPATQSKMTTKLDKLNDKSKQEIIEWALDQLDEDAKSTIHESLDDEFSDLVHYNCVNCSGKFTVDESDKNAEACCPKCGVDDYLLEISSIEMMMQDSVSDEEIEVDGLGMIECKTCHSSFTKDFLINGECPSCQTILIPQDDLSNTQASDDDNVDGFIQCPSCQRYVTTVSLHFDNSCRFCQHEFDLFEVAASEPTTEEISEHISKSDSGAYLDPEREAIEKIALEDAELIPVPGQDSLPLNKQKKRSGVIASLFKRKKS